MLGQRNRCCHPTDMQMLTSPKHFSTHSFFLPTECVYLDTPSIFSGHHEERPEKTLLALSGLTSNKQQCALLVKQFPASGGIIHASYLARSLASHWQRERSQSERDCNLKSLLAKSLLALLDPQWFTDHANWHRMLRPPRFAPGKIKRCKWEDVPNMGIWIPVTSNTASRCNSYSLQEAQKKTTI